MKGTGQDGEGGPSAAPAFVGIACAGGVGLVESTGVRQVCSRVQASTPSPPSQPPLRDFSLFATQGEQCSFTLGYCEDDKEVALVRQGFLRQRGEQG